MTMAIVITNDMITMVRYHHSLNTEHENERVIMIIVIFEYAILIIIISINLHDLRETQTWQLEIADQNGGLSGKSVTGGFSRTFARRATSRLFGQRL